MYFNICPPIRDSELSVAHHMREHLVKYVACRKGAELWKLRKISDDKLEWMYLMLYESISIFTFICEAKGSKFDAVYRLLTIKQNNLRKQMIFSPASCCKIFWYNNLSFGYHQLCVIPDETAKRTILRTWQGILNLCQCLLCWPTDLLCVMNWYSHGRLREMIEK